MSVSAKNYQLSLKITEELLYKMKKYINCIEIVKKSRYIEKRTNLKLIHDEK